jgi:RimJ/RimL family protein N-acetyltransferase
MARHEYRLDLRAYHPPAAHGGASGARPLAPEDAEGLAALMIDAYAGTIDSDGETLDDARAEVASYFAGRSGAPLLDASRLLPADGAVTAACLVSLWDARRCPLVAYLMTGAASKGRGLAGRLLHQSLAALAAAGYPEARAVVTEGNTPSERLLTRAGFERVTPP